MAEPLADQVYLPPLESCLKGETIILSWKLVASALLDPTGHRQSSECIIGFFSDPLVQSFFTSPGSAFESQSDKIAYKTIFENKTAAIQVTPTPNDKYDISVIKEDALWLSKNADINLITALRIVVIELQSRPKSQLLGPISKQDVASLRAAAGASSAQTSNIIPGLNLTANRDASDIQAEFDKPDSRRQRIFQTYLSERRFYAATNEYIFTLMLHDKLPMSPATEASKTIRKSLLEVYGISTKQPQKAIADIPTKTCHALVAQYVGLLPECLERAVASLEKQVDQILITESIQEEQMQTHLTEMLHRMTILFQLLDRSGDCFVSDAVARQWFSLVDALEVLNQLHTYPSSIADLAIPIQCLVCIISLRLLNLPRMMAFFESEIDLDTDNEFLATSNILEQIHDVLEGSVTAGAFYMAPVLFAWVTIVHAMYSSYQDRVEKRDTIQNEKAVENYDSNRQITPTLARRNSAGSITTIDKRRYDDFLINKNLDRDFQRLQLLAAVATDEARVFDVITVLSTYLGPTNGCIFPPSVGSRMRVVFLDLLKVTYPFVGYKAEPVTALLSVLSGGQGYWDIARNETSQNDVISHVLHDEIVLEIYVQQALDRFPYEFAPFLALCRTLCSAPALSDGSGYEHMVQLLEKTPTLTFTLPDHFTGYYLANEDENANVFQFADDFALFSPATSRKKMAAEEERFVIPAGTYGRFIVDEGKVVRVEYEHSTLALLGKQLEANLVENRYDLALGTLEADAVAEIITLFATLIRTAVLRAAGSDDKTFSSPPAEAARNILAEASQALSRTKDVITVVCETLDKLLDEDKQSSAGLGALNACVEFLHAILPISPGRVWSYLSRCSLLEGRAQGGKLARLVGDLELSSVQLELLTSAIRLFSALLDSAMSSAVQRKMEPKVNSRQRTTENVWLGLSDKVTAQVTLAISHATVDMLESSSTWRFPTDLDRMILIRDVVPTMAMILTMTFGTDNISDKNSLMSALLPAANFVLDSFLGPTAGSLRVLPLLGTLVTATQGSESTIYAKRSQVYREQTLAVLQLVTTLVRVADYSERSSSVLEDQLFKVTPYIARLCARDEFLKGPSIELLESLVVSAGKTVGEPPSLLGYLGPQSSRAFLQLLSHLDRPFSQAEEGNAIWRFFSTIVRNRQQWMANCLLTGKTPRDSRGSKDKVTETSTGSILSSALVKLTSISNLDRSEALSILDFITSAQNYWPWTIFTIHKDHPFLNALVRFIKNLRRSTVIAKIDIFRACQEARIAAYIAEIFAMQLFHLRQLGEADSAAAVLAPCLDYYLREGVSVDGYNRGLHANFTRNFTQQYPSCSLDNLKRTLIEPRILGADFYYALSFADRILNFDPSWVGPTKTGFRSEMVKANINLSLVDAQVALYHAWEFLLLELSACLPNNDILKKQSLQVAQECLTANEKNQAHDDEVFVRLAESRVNLALILVQRVVDSAPSLKDVAPLLNAVWATVSSYQEPYRPENIAIYRTLLRLLYVTLRAAVRSSGPNDFRASVRDEDGNVLSPVPVSQTALGILDHAVSRGFRTIVSLIHDSEAAVCPGDVVMINAVLQACLCIPGMDQSQTQILNILATHNSVQAAVSLYSWSDKLAEQGDPVYGELALLHLLELSKLPLVAEQLACDGLLDHITSASLATYLRRPNVSPFADSVGLQRCYSIWAKGIVPILLNILSALGATIAPEVAYVLNQFPNLMQSSVDRFEAPGDSQRRGHRDRAFITALSAAEIHSLALITQVLRALRSNNARDIPVVEWDSNTLLENVDWWIDHRKVLRERLVALGPREAEWKTMPPSEAEKRRGCESRLEARIVDQLELVRAVLNNDLE
ncbi:nucleoporin subcomplex protein binding to Pom34-domain-containing protein [Xylariaceae sp. FL0594]|nr:nucleoporin subcomplex protein binding to Pom34-domain-containing protein [Xylariaceae sp. FL0594]